MKTLLITLTVLLGVALTGCSSCGDTQTSPKGDTDIPQAVYSEADIIEHLGLDADGYFYVGDEAECEAAVILTSAGQVSMYADAGDTVAANPSHTAGVKIISDNDPLCQTAMTNVLSALP